MSQATNDKIGNILADRGSKYGDYTSNAHVTQSIMRALHQGENSHNLNDNHVEALHMIAHKMSRIVNGDPDLHDSWDDIAGYAKLVSDRIGYDKKSQGPEGEAPL